MTGKQRLLVRLSLSLLMGVIVAYLPLSLIVGGPQSRDIWFRRRSTLGSFKRIDRVLNSYHRWHKSYPSTLKSLGYVGDDGWGRPFIYSLPNNRPLVESLGKDGVRGGNGMDADLSNRNPKPAQGQVPLWERITDPDALSMTFTALMCGLVAAYITFAGLESQTFAPREWPLLGVSLLLCFGMAVVGAIFITAMHIPSGH